jgi:hypothetical protein
VAWEDDNAIWVAEVKSLTPTNEKDQLRYALGQVLQYRHLLDGGTKPVRAVIATEIPPVDDGCVDTCGEQGVALVWPAALAQFLRHE